MGLTDRVINGLKPSQKLYKKNDGGGLNLVVHPTGTKVWWLQYRLDGKQRTLVLGKYPAINLSAAREMARSAKEQLYKGKDPGIQKKVKSRSLALGIVPKSDGTVEPTFGIVMDEWFGKKRYSAGHRKNTSSRIERYIRPALGSMPIKDITVSDLNGLLMPIEEQGAYETAHRLYQIIGNVFRRGVKLGLCERDITADMKGMLEPRKEKHHPTITEPAKVGELLRKVYSHEGYFPLSCALKLAPLLFVRPGELRGATWSEFNLDNAEWRIPAERMKQEEPHIVPLSNQAIDILLKLQKFNGYGNYLFPSIRTTSRTISENSLNVAMYQLGVEKGTFVSHAFRSMASTLLNQMGWNRDWIERQLAHMEGSVRASYNFADFLPQRKVMMQAYSNYLERLRLTTEKSLPDIVTPISMDYNRIRHLAKQWLVVVRRYIIRHSPKVYERKPAAYTPFGHKRK